MNVEELLTDRFIKAVKKSFQPCPLIGPKWFSYNDKISPPCFQFTGVKSLAKATSSQQRAIAERVLRNLDTSGIDADVEITPEFKINLKFRSLPETD